MEKRTRKEHTSNPNRSPVLEDRTLPQYIAPLLRADAKSYTDATNFVQRNSTFFTTRLNRNPYTPASSPSPSPSSSSDSITSSPPPQIPIQALHTAAAALTLVPPTHWTIETHRTNINSYDGSDAVSVSSAPESTSSGEGTGSTATLPAADKIFKKELYHYLRWALSASAPGPGIPETMAILGRRETVRRVQEAKSLTESLIPSAGRRVPKSSSAGGAQGADGDRSWMGSLAPKR